MKHFFESYILVQQDIITSNEAVSKFLSLPGISELKPELEKDFYSESIGSSHKWIRLSDVLEKHGLKKVLIFFLLAIYF